MNRTSVTRNSEEMKGRWPFADDVNPKLAAFNQAAHELGAEHRTHYAIIYFDDGMLWQSSTLEGARREIENSPLPIFAVEIVRNDQYRGHFIIMPRRVPPQDWRAEFRADMTGGW